MALFNELIKQKGRMGHTGFWDSKYGVYSQINAIDDIKFDPNTLRKIQLENIKKQIKINPRLMKANEFIKNLPNYNQNKTEEIAANQIFNRIAMILNSPFQSGDLETRQLSDRVDQLNKLLKMINTEVIIPKKVINTLSENSILTKDTGLYTYRQEKAKLFEEIVAAYFNGIRVNSAITTGSWGKISDNNRQLVTDIYAFIDDKKPHIKGKYSLYEKTGYWKTDIARASGGIQTSVSSDLNNFIEEMSKLNGKANIGISIDDELADTLDTVSSLKIQAKSGINQSILNTNYRNAIQLKIFSDPKLNLLTNLYYLDQAQEFLHFYKKPKDSITLTAYANYLLSINIEKTSLIESNDIYFTEHGFETIYDWLNSRNVYLKFQNNIKMDAQLLSKNRKYNFNMTSNLTE